MVSLDNSHSWHCRVVAAWLLGQQDSLALPEQQRGRSEGGDVAAQVTSSPGLSQEDPVTQTSGRPQQYHVVARDAGKREDSAGNILLEDTVRGTNC